MAIQADGTGSSPGTFAVGSGIGPDDYVAGVRIFAFEGIIQAITPGFPHIGTYTPGTWIDVSMTLDYATQTYSVSADGTLLASNLAFCGDASDSSTCLGNHISQFGDVEFNPNSPKAGAFYIDDVSISAPEPSAWALMLAGFAGLGAALRSRRRQSLRRTRDGHTRRALSLG